MSVLLRHAGRLLHILLGPHPLSLCHACRHVRRTLEQLLQLLPGFPPTQLLLDTLADLDLPPEILALQHQEADAAFRACLGAHVTPAALHYMLQGWRRQRQEQPHTDKLQQQQQQQAQGQQQQQWPAAGGQLGPQQQSQQQQLARQARQPRPPLTQQVAALAELLGPEVAYAAMHDTPELLDAQPARLLANLRWLQQQLQLSPVAALLLAQTAGGVLLLPSRVLEARYSNLCYLLLQLLGWKLRQAHTLLCNAPQLLGWESAVLANNWQLVQQLARRRSGWLEELAGGSQGVVAAVLGAEQRALQQLRYAAEARELRGCGLVRVLRMQYVDFLHACPGFRVWRSAVPAEKQRWSLVEAGRCVVSVGPDAGQPRRQHMGGKVLAVDRKGSPVLIQLT